MPKKPTWKIPAWLKATIAMVIVTTIYLLARYQMLPF